MENWGERLQRAIEQQQINKSYALAYELGVAESTVSRWKQSGPISTKNAIQLCDALDVSMDWLLAGRENPNISEKSDTVEIKKILYQKIDALPSRAITALADFLDSVVKT